MRSVTPAAIAWPPPFSKKPSVTACRTALPRSTPPIERPDPVPMPPGSSAMAKAGRENFSFSRAATRPDHAGMPAFRRGDDNADLVLEPERGQRLGFGLRFGRLLDHAALAVEAVELGRDPRRLDAVAFEQQPHAEIGAADAAAGIDARPQHEAEMPGLRRAVEPRHIHQRGVADMVAPPHRDQALGDEGAVEPDQRRDVGDGAERDVMQHAEQVRLGHLAVQKPRWRSSRLTATSVTNTRPTAAR